MENDDLLFIVFLVLKLAGLIYHIYKMKISYEENNLKGVIFWGMLFIGLCVISK